MKKVLVLILASAFAGGAWAEKVIPVQSVNQFGAVKVTGTAATMYVAVPFEGFDDNPVVATNVIHAAGLTDGTKMYIWNPQAKEYNVFKAESGKWTPMAKATMTDDDDEELGYADPEFPVKAGTGALLERVATSEPAYVYGQIPMSPVPSPTFGQGQTLVCIPSTNAMQAVNLNAFTWTGVNAAKSNRSLISGADYIQFRDEQNRQIKYYYLDGAGWGLQPRSALKYPELVANGQALVPAGTAFWYYTSTGGAKVEWE